MRNHSDQVGELAWWVRGGVSAIHDDASAKIAASEVRDEPVHQAQEGALAAARFAQDEGEFSLNDFQVYFFEGRMLGAGVCECHVVKNDHAGTISGSRVATSAGGFGVMIAGVMAKHSASRGTRGTAGQIRGLVVGFMAVG